MGIANNQQWEKYKSPTWEFLIPNNGKITNNQTWEIIIPNKIDIGNSLIFPINVSFGIILGISKKPNKFTLISQFGNLVFFPVLEYESQLDQTQRSKCTDLHGRVL